MGELRGWIEVPAPPALLAESRTPPGVGLISDHEYVASHHANDGRTSTHTVAKAYMSTGGRKESIDIIPSDRQVFLTALTTSGAGIRSECRQASGKEYMPNSVRTTRSCESIKILDYIGRDKLGTQFMLNFAYTLEYPMHNSL